jgi:pimeloyl-ACP methyl ester carboxylesterase/uncharacterized protein YegL
MKQRAVFLWVLLFSVFFVGEASSRQSSAAKVHPVIFIHGINDTAGNWEDHKGGDTVYYYLVSDGYEAKYVTTFGYRPDQRANDFVDDDQNDRQSDSFGDVSTVADYLSKEIDFLYQQSGGIKVDIVAHSLGGLVTREYLRQHPNDHKIGKFIDIASPHSGSGIIGGYDSFSLPPPFPKELKSGIVNILNSILTQFGFGFPDPNSTAAQQLVPNSQFLQTLNSSPSPSDVQYWMLYGDIQLQVNIELFWFEVYSEPVLAGDLTVSRENAATIPGLGSFGKQNPSNYHTIGFESPTNVVLTANLSLDDIDFGVKIDGDLDEIGPYWHNGLLRNPDLNQKVLAILNDGYALPIITPTVINSITTTPPPAVPVSSSYGNSSTVMLFDISGSMNEGDVTGVAKLDAAKGAGSRILDIIEAENSAAQGADVGVLSFSYGAWVNSALSPDVGAARSALDGLYANGGTGMADGLRLAIDQFQNTQQDSKPIIILLSDGVPSLGLGGTEFIDESEIRQQVFDLASEAGSKGICIYTVGFGVPDTVGFISGGASIDEELLKQVSANSGCGAYYNAQNATELANVYVNLRHESTGSVVLQKTGNISQNETVELGLANVAQGTNEMLFTLNWPGSRLDPSLVDPSGKIVDHNYPGAHFFQTNSLASVIISNPAAGNWKFTALGAEVPEGIIGYNAVVSVRGNNANVVAPTGGSVPAALVIVPLLIGGLLTYMVVVSSKRGRKQPGRAVSAARLFVTAGQGVGRTISLRDNLIIGRSRISNIYVADPSVSRRHARIRFSNEQWFIQDMGSSSGVYVNGAKVNASVLRSGDHIRIGSTEFEFQG